MKRFVPFLFALLLIPVGLAAITSARKPAYFQTNQLAHLNHPRYRDLVGHWIMNESGGLTAYDISGNGNNGTLTNGPTWTQGQFGPALSFDGVDDFISVSEAVTDSAASNGALTISAWFRLSTTSDGDLVSQWKYSATDRAFDLRWTGTKIEYHIDSLGTGSSGGSNRISNTTLSTNTLYHVVGVFKASANLDIYVNGVLDNGALYVNGIPNGLFNAVNPVNIGRISNGDADLYFNGLIDDVRVYKRALSADEVMSLYTDPFLEFRRDQRLALRKPSVAKVKHRVTQQ